MICHCHWGCCDSSLWSGSPKKECSQSPGHLITIMGHAQGHVVLVNYTSHECCKRDGGRTELDKFTVRQGELLCFLQTQSVVRAPWSTVLRRAMGPFSGARGWGVGGTQAHRND